MKNLFLILVLLLFSLKSFAQTTSVEYYNEGKSFMQLKDIDGAIKSFTKAISLNPNYEMAYVSRALCKMAKGNWSSAIPDCNKTLEINPNQAVAYFIRGCAKANTKNNGCSDLNKALELGYSQAQSAIIKYCK